MEFQLNENLGSWLTQLNDKTVEKIYQVDFNNNRHQDNYLPWQFFITFHGFDKFLQIEGDFDGDHIKIDLDDISNLEDKLKENDLKNEFDLWTVYTADKSEKLGQLLNGTIRRLEYGIDKDNFVINETRIQGQKDVFTFIRFYLDDSNLTISEGGCGLYVSDDPNEKLNFEETFNTYETGKNKKLPPTKSSC
ncbi:MAG: hypothetical protein RJQ14_05215 [Marinoscillum sp.]